MCSNIRRVNASNYYKEGKCIGVVVMVKLAKVGGKRRGAMGFIKCSSGAVSPVLF